MADVLEGTRGAPPYDDRADEVTEPPEARSTPSDPGRGGGLLDRIGRASPESWVSFFVVGLLVVYTVAQLHPDLLVRDTTPTGGDMGAHVWGPAFLRDHLLPDFRLSGWSPDWYLGLPTYHYYMVVPALLVVALDVVLPYGIALKLVSVAGIATLPIAAWAMGRLGGMRFPFPPLLAAGATLFLFDEHFTIYGGNIASTMAGEFSFSIALSLAVLYIGVLAHGLRTGRNRAWAAGLLALCALCHLIVSFFALAATAVLFLLYLDRQRFRYLASFGVVTGLLVTFWMLPFWWQRGYMTDMAYERREDYWAMFFPSETGTDRLLMALAVVGLVAGIVHRRRMNLFLAITALGFGVWARYWPQGHLWNARLLPFLYLTRTMLVVVGVGELAVGALELWRRRPAVVRTLVATVPVLVALGAMVIVSMGIRNLPGGEASVETAADGTTRYLYSWGPFESDRSAVVDDWARWNYLGYEEKDAYGEYRAIVDTMGQVGESNGCGRALWENNNATNSYGTPMALMLLPFWTDGCIGSSEGLFFEASATTPYHFLAAAALSASSSNPVRNLDYVNADVPRGVVYLQRMGIKYYMAFSPSIVAQAAVHPDLTEVAVSGPWHVYDVAGTDLVEGVRALPVVVEGVGEREAWLDMAAAELADLDSAQVPRVASGPEEWARVGAEDEVVPTVPVDPVVVSDLDLDTDRISFSVDRVGVPVVVKASYFPNWDVDGADGPYRMAPNLMVVVPTDTDVTLSYGREPVELVAYGASAVGLLGLVLLWRAGPVAVTPVVERARRRPAAAVAPGLVFDWDEPTDVPPAAGHGHDHDHDDGEDDADLWAQLSEALGEPVGPGTPRTDDPPPPAAGPPPAGPPVPPPLAPTDTPDPAPHDGPDEGPDRPGSIT